MKSFKEVFNEGHSELHGAYYIGFNLNIVDSTYVAQLPLLLKELLPKVLIDRFYKLYKIVPGVYMTSNINKETDVIIALHYYSDDFNLLLDTIEKDFAKRVSSRHFEIAFKFLLNHLNTTKYDNVRNAFRARERVKQIKHLGYSDTENSDIL